MFQCWQGVVDGPSWKSDQLFTSQHQQITPTIELQASTKTLAECGSSGQPSSECMFTAEETLRRQSAAGFGLEDSSMVIEGMAQQGVEPTFCMGDDNPLAVLSTMPHMLYTYFKQRFAQVRTELRVPHGLGWGKYICAQGPRQHNHYA